VARGFLPQPVPKELLTKILDAARNCASAENTQPWEFTVFGGQVMEDMRKACQERFRSGAKPNSEISFGPGMFPDKFRERIMGRGGPTLLTALKIDPSDKEARGKLWMRGIGFWGAPNGIIIHTERNLPLLSTIDVGSMLTTILLLAHSHGLGCCPSLQMVFWPDIARQYLKIPESQFICIGISIGYPDKNDPINSFKSFRLPLEEMVTWQGI